MATDTVAKAFQKGDHATTFGGGPVVCAAALAVMDEIDEKELLANCVERSHQFKDLLWEVPGVVTVRGRGLLLAAVLDGDRAGEVAAAAMENGLIVNAVRPNAVRFAPPLSISADEVTEAVRRFAASL
jgi:acetylornithine/N-succinyldiaminopimelate aminotransferase